MLTTGSVVFKLKKDNKSIVFLLSIFLVRLFLEFIPMFSEKYNVDFFLSDKLNQDPIEEHFGRIRSAGGASDNPTFEQYGYRNRKFIVAKSE